MQTSDVRHSDPAMEAIGVSHTFTRAGRTVTAMQHMNPRVQAGEFVCIVGPSGCGKSTLLNMVAGLLQPGSGQIRYHGVPVPRPNTNVQLLTEFAQASSVTPVISEEEAARAIEIANVARDEPRTLSPADAVHTSIAESVVDLLGR